MSQVFYRNGRREEYDFLRFEPIQHPSNDAVIFIFDLFQVRAQTQDSLVYAPMERMLFDVRRFLSPNLHFGDG